MSVLFASVCVSTAVCVLALRLYFLITKIRRRRLVPGNPLKSEKGHLFKVMIVAGSGGHTTEILRLTRALGSQYKPRHYVMAKTDKMSEMKIHDSEKCRKVNSDSTEYEISFIPRSREVLQSWISTVFSTFISCMYSIPLVCKSRPDLVLVNGPGTCIPICLGAFLLSFLGLKKVSIIYVESMCRVDSMSMCGKILYHFADFIIVQWPELKEKYPETIYMGRVV